MRTLLASALLALACGCTDSSSRPSGADATPVIPGGPDPVVLRVSRDGGVISAYPYPGLDSVLWRGVSRAPALRRVVGFGAEDGYLAAMDAQDAPVRIDLRLGTTAASRDTGQRAASSYDGAAIYSLTADGSITRFTPSGGSWRVKPTLPVAALFAVSDGSLLVAGASKSDVVIWRVRPPGEEAVDTLRIAVGGIEADNAAMISATAGVVGDRIYFGAHESVIAVRSRDLFKMLDLDLGAAIVAIEPTPSGDRLFVALRDDNVLRIVDRFEERVSGKVKLPGQLQGLRMDPMGRILLVRGAGDSVYVVSVADDALQGVVQSAWRHDLPLVLADGAIALVRGADVVLAAPRTLANGRVIEKGGQDFWYGLRWNGFRPRSAGLDQPVEFRRSAPREVASDSSLTFDSLSARADNADASGAGGGSAAGRPIPTGGRRDSAAAAAQFTVSFAAVQSEATARELAARIRVDGQTPRITAIDRNGAMLYRVVMGPYPSREVADRVGKASGQSYWIFEGVP